jgi:hypothetical protein
MPASYPLSKPMTLAEAVAVHNATVPTMPASLHYNDSALLIHMQGKLFCWALLRNLSASDASEILISSVRFFPTRDTRVSP